MTKKRSHIFAELIADGFVTWYTLFIKTNLDSFMRVSHNMEYLSLYIP